MKPALVSLVIATTSLAGSATWSLDPASDDWNTATNWTPETVPNDPSDIATFNVSNQTALAISQLTTVGSIVFNPTASAFTITAAPTQTFVFAGAGLTNSSVLTQNFVTAVDELGNPGLIQFIGSATVTGPVIFTNHGSISGLFGALDGETQFFDSSSAGEGNFFNLGDENGGGAAVFYGNANAGNGDFFNVGGSSHTYFYDTSSGAQGRFLNVASGITLFTDSATAADGIFVNDQGGITEFNGTVGVGTGSSGGNGVYINNGTNAVDQNPGATLFYYHSDAGNGTYIANSGANGFPGGLINFAYGPTGGTAKMILHGNGSLDISQHYSGITIGSLSGNGLVFLGNNTLTVGADNSSTHFTGVIQDGGSFDTKGGTLRKIGTGTLTLSGSNIHRGGTRVSEGRLWVNNPSGTGTGKGAVLIDGGTLGGRGIISGIVTVGSDAGTGGVLSPGNLGGGPNVLTMQKTLTFNSDATYKVGLDTRTGVSDQISANGVTIGAGAQFSFNPVGGQALSEGTVFTAISNASASPISGTFANLPDGGTITVGNNTFEATYEGGDGNDLTLTVVP